MPPIVAAAAIIAGGSLVGGAVQARGARRAGREQAAAARDAFDLTREDTEAYREAGGVGLQNLLERLQAGFNFEQDPGYDFRLNQGNRAIDRAAGRPSTSRGAGGPGRYSGATLKALTQYGQDFASDEYGRAFDRYRQGNQEWFNLASLGAGAAGAGADLLTQEGNARAAGTAGSANAIGGAIGNAGQLAALAALLSGGGGGAAPAQVPTWDDSVLVG